MKKYNFESVSICKGDVCLHAKGELAEALLGAIIGILLVYSAVQIAKSLN